MNDMKMDPLQLENQLCFPMYACAKEVIRLYRPYLDALGLTYTQYITLMVLWADQQVSMKNLGDRLLLDSGTLTPLVKKLEAQGLVTRRRAAEDERILLVTLTDKGKKLKKKAADIPASIAAGIGLEPEESKELYRLLNKVLHSTR